eukprot:30977-Pelagococcus_subviridis.AAC.2
MRGNVAVSATVKRTSSMTRSLGRSNAPSWSKTCAIKSSKSPLSTGPLPVPVTGTLWSSATGSDSTRRDARLNVAFTAASARRSRTFVTCVNTRHARSSVKCSMVERRRGGGGAVGSVRTLQEVTPKKFK